MSAAPQQRDDAAASDAERAAACALAGLAGIGNQSLALIKDAYGTLSAAAEKGGQVVATVPGLRADGVESLRAAPDLVKRGDWLLNKARELGARVVLQTDAEYPSLLRSSGVGPPVLYMLGQFEDGVRRVAVVGTREPDDYGDARTDVIVDHLCAAGIEVVSGGATGVDKRAHQQALRRGARTTAVLGCGFLKPYPSNNKPMYDAIAKQGTLISEFALDAGGNRTHFPQRNRTMAGLAEAVVMTRGTATSGALMTCQTSVRIGRPVFAVPGQVGDALAAGPNSLLASVARAAITGAEVARALGLVSQEAPMPPPLAPERPAVDVSKLPVGQQQVIAQLGAAPRHVDEIAHDAGLPTAEALSVLLQLELAGLCIARPGKYFQRR